MWPKVWGPQYVHSYAICIATNGACIVMCYFFRQHLASLNRKQEERERAEGREKGYRFIL